MINYTAYYFVLFLTKVIMLIPKKPRRGFFKLLAYITYLLFSKNKKVIKQNLLYVYDDKIDEQKIKQIQKSCYKKLFLTILSIIENEHLSSLDIENMVTFENKEHIKTIQKPYIYITAHMGNLDVLGVIIGHFFGQTTHVQQKIKNPYLNNYMQKQREKYGIKVVDKYGAVKKLYIALKNSKIISLVIDQNVNPKYATNVKFLNKDTIQTSTAALLAKRFNIPLLPVFITGEDDKYKVIFKEPIYPKDKSLETLNQDIADVMSKVIFEYPQEWFWCHKRFKNSNPNMYKS